EQDHKAAARASTAAAATVPATPAATEPVPALVATPAAEPTPVPEPEPEPLAIVNDFNVAEAMDHVRALCDIGVRKGGSAGEKKAAEYIAAQLKAMGYDADIRAFPLPNGTTSRNVVASLPGTTDRTFVLGAHYDTKSPSPGANDNGTGTAALLAIARELKDEKLAPTVEFVFFGTEEMIDSNSDHHHYGSRKYVAMMTSDERARCAGMISVDMIGYGPEFVVRTMGTGPQTLKDRLLAAAKAKSLGLFYKKDTSAVGWSDHEPFERAGIPAAWIEWRDDPYYHKTTDTPAHVVKAKVAVAGGLVLDYVRSLDEDDLAALRAR
ncbi:MAG: M20/M25/M40 family metallo-hydrolase, partial [Actinobacteria bacterium]